MEVLENLQHNEFLNSLAVTYKGTSQLFVEKYVKIHFPDYNYVVVPHMFNVQGQVRYDGDLGEVVDTNGVLEFMDFGKEFYFGDFTARFISRESIGTFDFVPIGPFTVAVHNIQNKLLPIFYDPIDVLDRLDVSCIDVEFKDTFINSVYVNPKGARNFDVFYMFKGFKCYIES